MAIKRINRESTVMQGTSDAENPPTSLNLDARGSQDRARGKPMNLYMHPEDIKRIRELAAYLAGKGFRVSDSQVVKAALRATLADETLISAYIQAASSDRRYKRLE